VTANTQPVSTVDPAVGSAQIVRRVSSTLKLAKDTYQSNEIRSDRQIYDFRHGVKRVTGGIWASIAPAPILPSRKPLSARLNRPRSRRRRPR
jgi:hypothetical protein